MVRGGRRNAARCVVSVIGLATLLAVLCVCFASAAHHDEAADRDVVTLAAAPTTTGGSPAPAAEETSVGHGCPPGERCASAAHTAGIALPAPEPSVPSTLGEAGLPAAPVDVHPARQASVHRHAPSLHVLQVQRT